MFPFDIENDYAVADTKKIPKDYEIDFDTMTLTGKVITGLQAIKQWAMIVLRTDRYFYTQYTWDHGCEIQSLVGKSYKPDLVKSEVKRMIEDALLVSDDIDSISNLVCTLDGDKLNASFVINTKYGGGEINV